MRQPRRVVVLAPEEARQLVDSIDVSTHAGLRDRALIGFMVYTFTQIDQSDQRIGMPYCRPPFVQSALTSRDNPLIMVCLGGELT